MARHETRSRASSRYLIALGLAALSGIAVFVVSGLEWLLLGELLNGFELRTIDYRYRLREGKAPRDDIAIVAVDDSTVARLGWPCPWEKTAQVIDALDAAGARTIVFDIFFVDKRKSDPTGEDDLARATRESGRVIHAGYHHQASSGPLSDEQVSAWERFRLTPRVRSGGVVPSFEGLVPPLPSIAAASRGLGYADLPTSADNTFRAVFHLAVCDDGYYPSLALAAAMADLGVDPEDIVLETGRAIRLGPDRRVPINGGGHTLIDFAGGRGEYPVISFADVLEWDRDLARQKVGGKLVLVGSMATGDTDLRPNPFSGNYSGVETHACAIADILSNRFLRESAPAADLLLLVGLTLIIGLIAPRVAPLPGAAAALFVVLGYDIAAVELFRHARLVVQIVPQNIAVVLAYVAILIYRLFSGEREREQLRATFGRYVPEQIADRVASMSPAALLEGERREVTVLFTDIRNFTSLTQEMQPEDTVALLNRYFTLMHEVVWKFEGTLDKYMGDAIMAVWNAPADQPGHVELAVQAALEMQRQVEANQDEWAFLGMPRLRVGMGVHTGVAVAGNVGSKQRVQYTVMGDEVNLAWRLQELTKQYDFSILVSGDVHEAAAHLVEATELDTVQVRGRSARVPVYAIRPKAGG